MVRLTVTHDELEPGSGMDTGIRQGWPIVLSSLKSLLETGKGSVAALTASGDALSLPHGQRWDQGFRRAARSAQLPIKVGQPQDLPVLAQRNGIRSATHQHKITPALLDLHQHRRDGCALVTLDQCVAAIGLADKRHLQAKKIARLGVPADAGIRGVPRVRVGTGYRRGQHQQTHYQRKRWNRTGHSLSPCPGCWPQRSAFLC
ncbi:hypothetical protein G6F35_011284 [Rhizopus arrhizus]|nr:hypothetical protein G6F35_011284 [Rhizopus arrhizus]